MSNQITFNNKKILIGDTVQVNYRLIEREIVAGRAKREKKEETRERIQAFEGIVIKMRGEGENKSFTVRRIGSAAIGIERIFPLSSPWIKSIKVKKHAKVRRAKLYYLRDKVGKEAQKLKGGKMLEEIFEPDSKDATQVKNKSIEVKPVNPD
ncbi:50S ribosomal protein L19 [Candidatus Gottesmanbacteria bacterium RBG_16_37_8]|uniref:50S ribosomal protein L19 n=1 Tax=Candidatus Gottesmanbacteria bacterium RBG_16_37_8 TaxID=1798371 RepID=A0A1F5YTE9_9BACT|nr:MAG: 50S ribosomal protein L19 [Candidatus Gottesmanbacteria bacterium RBG_16_37_8]